MIGLGVLGGSAEGDADAEGTFFGLLEGGFPLLAPFPDFFGGILKKKCNKTLKHVFERMTTHRPVSKLY